MRKQNSRLVRRVLILCEGETETNYLISYKLDEPNRRRLSSVEIDIYKPKNHSPIGLVEEAKKRIRDAKKDYLPFERAWIVFDKDGHYGKAEAFQKVLDHNRSPKRSTEISIAFSAHCFEVWYALHFEKRVLRFANSDQAKSYITRNYIPEYHDSYNTYQFLKHKNISMHAAMTNCDWLMAQNRQDLDNGRRWYEFDCWCNVHDLMRFLEDL